MTLFALTEAVSIARSLAARSGQQLDGNQEFIGQGLSINRSALNYAAGARTPVAAVLAGLLLMGIVVLVAPLVAYLPYAAMAAILFIVAWGLIDLHHIRRIVRTSRQETAVLAVTFFGALLLDLEFAILAGVILSLVLYLLMQGVNFADVAGAELLEQAARRLRAAGGGLYLYRPKEGVLEVLRRGGYLEAIGEENCFRSKGEAIAAIVARLDPQVCGRCTARIFTECAQRPGPEGAATAGR